MVKETKFRHYPTRIETGLFMGSEQLDIVGVRLAFLDDSLTPGTDISTQGDWHPMDIASLVVTAGGTVPQDAVAVILDVEVKDDGVGEYYMEFASVDHLDVAVVTARYPDGTFTSPGKTETVYIGQGADRYGSRTIIVELSEDFNILTKVTGVNLDYAISLIGWLIGGTRIAKVTWPSVDLYAKFTI